MLPDVTLPASLSALLAVFAPCFTVPSFRTFWRRGRPRVRGARLPALAAIAATAEFTPVTVTRYRKTATVRAAALTCLWHTVFGAQQARVILIRDTAACGFNLALVTTDLHATPPRASSAMPRDGPSRSR